MFSVLVDEHVDCIKGLAALAPAVETAARLLAGVIDSQGCIFVCGNGGSAADAQHFAAELVGRFESERRALPAVALTTDTSILTAVANDYGFDRIFTRQLEGLARPGDALLGLSTSGNSANVIQALRTAAELNLSTVGLTGGAGGTLAAICQEAIVVPYKKTARVQEAHLLVLHYFAQIIEQTLGSREND